MLAWLKRLLGSEPRDERLPALEREAQTLRLDLAERETALADLKAELERRRMREGERVDQAVRHQLERLMADAAAPASQLRTQAHLLHQEDRPVKAADVLAVAAQLVDALEDHGLALEGQVGETVAFDPNRHQVLGGEPPEPGQPAVVRFVGVTCNGKRLQKAGVEKT